MRQIQYTHFVHNNHIIRYKGQYEVFFYTQKLYRYKVKNNSVTHNPS